MKFDFLKKILKKKKPIVDIPKEDVIRNEEEMKLIEIERKIKLTIRTSFKNKDIKNPGKIYAHDLVERPSFLNGNELATAKVIYFLLEHIDFNTTDLLKGCMILDSIILDNKSYQFSTSLKEEYSCSCRLNIFDYEQFNKDFEKEWIQEKRKLKKQYKDLKNIPKDVYSRLAKIKIYHTNDFHLEKQLETLIKNNISAEPLLKEYKKAIQNIPKEYSFTEFLKKMEITEIREEKTIEKLYSYIIYFLNELILQKKEQYEHKSTEDLLRKIKTQFKKIEYLYKKKKKVNFSDHKNLLEKEKKIISTLDEMQKTSLKSIKMELSLEMYQKNLKTVLDKLLVEKNLINDVDIQEKLQEFQKSLEAFFTKNELQSLANNKTYSTISLLFVSPKEYMKSTKSTSSKSLDDTIQDFMRYSKYIVHGIIALVTFIVANNVVGFLTSPPPETYINRLDFILNNPYHFRGLFVLKPFYFRWIPIFIGLLFATLYVCVFFIINQGKREGIQLGTEKGSAAWIKNPSNLRLYKSNSQDNIILSKSVKVSVDPRYSNRNNNILVQGAPGTGKTRHFVLPNLMEGGYNFVVTDPKGQVLKETGKFFEERGYRIKILNLVQSAEDKAKNTFSSDGYNFFHYINSIEDIGNTVQALSNFTKEEDTSKGEDFWEGNALDVLKMIITYLKFLEKDEFKKNPTYTLELLRSIRSDKGSGRMKSIIQFIKEKETKTMIDDYVIGLWTQIEQMPDKTLGSVLTTANRKLSKFGSPAIQSLTKKDELHLEDFCGNEKCILYIITSDTDTSLNFLASMLYSQIFDVIYNKCAYLEGGRLPIPLQFIYDEFCNLGKQPNFLNRLSTARSRNIGISMIIQSFGQLEKLYGKDGRSVIQSDCDYLMSLGVGNDYESAKVLSDMLGSRTIKYSTTSKSNSIGGGTRGEHVDTRALLTPDEVMREEQAIIFISKMPRIRDPKYDLKQHPNYKKLSQDDTDTEIYSPGTVDERNQRMYQIRESLRMESEEKVENLPLDVSKNDRIPEKEEENISIYSFDDTIETNSNIIQMIKTESQQFIEKEEAIEQKEKQLDELEELSNAIPNFEDQEEVDLDDYFKNI